RVVSFMWLHAIIYWIAIVLQQIRGFSFSLTSSISLYSLSFKQSQNKFWIVPHLTLEQQIPMFFPW
ncbi:MAG: hypothetical protein SO016_10180, partial [Lachnospiraceae bacterium]|nr:hypothetical protein [Lachnospiraceae bacterium]